MAKSMAFWFRRKYNLPPTDPRFLSMTLEDIETEIWAHNYYDKPPGDEVEDSDFDLAAELRRIEEEAEAEEKQDWDEPI